jgi:hypothetical protein
MDEVMWVGPRRRPRFYVLGVAVLIVVAAVSVVVTNGRSTASAAKPGYSCAPPNTFGSGGLGMKTDFHLAYDGFTLKLTAYDGLSERSLPIDLVVSDATSRWVLPKPSDFQARFIDELCLVRFHGGSVPDVIMEGFSGGAHCCQLPVFYAFDGSHSRYDKVVDLTAPKSTINVAWDDNGGFEPMNVGGQILLRTEDDHFAYAFGCYACTPMPIQLDAFGEGGLTNVTGQHPQLVAKEAAQLRKLSLAQAKAEKSNESNYIGPFGPLAAYVADDCVLGRGAQAWATVEALQREGKLRNQLFAVDTGLDHGSFVATLKTFLVKGEYCVGQIG